MSNILTQSYAHIADDTKFIRLTTLTSFIHSLVFTFFVIFNIYRLIDKIQPDLVSWVNIANILQNLATIIPPGYYILIGLILVIGYLLLPPIGDASIIYYLNSTKKSGSGSLAKWIFKFFPMFEYNGMTTFFQMSMFLIVVGRLFTMDILDNTLVIIILAIRFVSVFAVSLFLWFTKFFIVLEWQWPIQASKSSFTLSMHHLFTVLRFVIINYILDLRFVLNLVLLVVLPLAMVYVADGFHILDSSFFSGGIYIMFAILFLLVSYINGIVEAFFTTYRYKLYVQLKQQTTD
jgi:hypothetical protein